MLLLSAVNSVSDVLVAIEQPFEDHPKWSAAIAIATGYGVLMVVFQGLLFSMEIGGPSIFGIGSSEAKAGSKLITGSGIACEDALMMYALVGLHGGDFDYTETFCILLSAITAAMSGFESLALLRKFGFERMSDPWINWTRVSAPIVSFLFSGLCFYCVLSEQLPSSLRHWFLAITGVGWSIPTMGILFAATDPDDNIIPWLCCDNQLLRIISGLIIVLACPICSGFIAADDVYPDL